MSQDNSIWDRLDKLPRQVYYTLLVIGLVVILIRPIGLPINIGKETEELYENIENLPEDSVVLVDIAFASGAIPELGPAFTAVMHHLFQKDVRVIIMTLYTEGPQMYGLLIENGIKPNQEYDKVYGEDYVFLGYSAGGVTTMAELATDMKLLGTDYRDNTLSTMPVMEGVDTHEDVDMVITFSTSSGAISSPADWVQQWATPYQANLACVVLKMMIPTVSPYYGSGQVKALVSGAGGSAEYELLVNKPGQGLASTDALSYAHILVIALVILGNISYFAKEGQNR
jgi:hypothetical protein